MTLVLALCARTASLVPLGILRGIGIHIPPDPAPPTATLGITTVSNVLAPVPISSSVAELVADALMLFILSNNMDAFAEVEAMSCVQEPLTCAVLPVVTLMAAD